ncbi:hypothetical protein EV363DRAFT_1353542 [Boletus edulis]|nr:hypothetical protein EV363DRAFT_1353542 [Boletus edulis]
MANTICTTSPTTTIMLIHFTGSLILMPYETLDCIGTVHALLTVLFAYVLAQDSQLSISERTVVFELAVHSHVVKGMPVGIGKLWGIMVMVVILVVTGRRSCVQQMEATVALLVSQMIECGTADMVSPNEV